MPRNAKKTVYREREFNAYVLWKSLPIYFRGMKKDQLVSYGFTDPAIIKIATIKNQTSFAKYFKIKDLGTLTDWNEKIKSRKLNFDKLGMQFKKQAVGVGEVMNSKPDKQFEKKILEYKSMISELKRDNSSLKEQVLKLKNELASMTRISHSPIAVDQTVNIVSDTTKTHVTHEPLSKKFWRYLVRLWREITEM